MYLLVEKPVPSMPMQKQHNVYHILAREPTSVKEEEGDGVREEEEDERRRKRMEQQLNCMQHLHDLQGTSDLLLATDKVG